MIKSVNLNAKLKANLIILGFITVLVGTTFTNGELWPFIPYDMYCREKATYEKKFWFKVTHTDTSSYYMRAESLYIIPRRFYLKINFLELKNIKLHNPERVQFVIDNLKQWVSRKLRAPVQIELYEETIYYINETQIKNRTMDFLGSSR